MDIAIVAVAYNRIDSLTRLLDSLDKAYYNDKKPTLIISIDKSKTDAVERFADEYTWRHGEKIVDKHEKNLGLRPHMMSLGKWLDRFDAIVVLEDDIVVSPDFYNYTSQTVEKYHDCPNIAGISLYGFRINYQTGLPFEPVKDGNDIYFMNCAMSWGEVWMRDSWKRFFEWYQTHQEFGILPHLPQAICKWGPKSWLRYHTRYCIEENLFFVHPYNSLTTNFSDEGEHNEGSSTLFQVPLQYGIKSKYQLPDFNTKAIRYNGFFENIALYEELGYETSNICLDLQGESQNRQKKQYWLTAEYHDYKIVKSYGTKYRPIELNVFYNNPGARIFLYDTQTIEKYPYKKNNAVLLYRYYIGNMFNFVRRYGFKNTYRDFVYTLRLKFKSLKK